MVQTSCQTNNKLVELLLEIPQDIQERPAQFVCLDAAVLKSMSISARR